MAIQFNKGSLSFGTEVMTTEECGVMVIVLSKNETDPEIIAKEIALFDDMLRFIRAELLFNAFSKTKTGRIRKNYTLQGTINTLLDNYLFKERTTLKGDIIEVDDSELLTS
jgi:hypothetical protein